jgi:tol-pal system-associated acyl-CoA thioesterase
MLAPHYFPIQVYYEDTDHSGLVYHANYLKFFERAREHLLGIEELVRLLTVEGIGFVVHDLAVTYREGARFGERLTVRSTATTALPYRLRLRQDVVREGGDRALVVGHLDLVCVGPSGKLVRLPESVVHRFAPESPRSRAGDSGTFTPG